MKVRQVIVNIKNIMIVHVIRITSTFSSCVQQDNGLTTVQAFFVITTSLPPNIQWSAIWFNYNVFAKPPGLPLLVITDVTFETSGSDVITMCDYPIWSLQNDNSLDGLTMTWVR